MPAQTPAGRVTPFAPNSALYSDGATKLRFAYVPEGKAAAYVADEAFDFPVGSALVKTFAFPADMRRPDEDVRLIETRVLLRQEAGWTAWAYLWNDAQTDAELRIAGAKVPIALTETDGSAVAFDYSVPNRNQCKACHAVNGEIAPIGPKARHLDGDFAYPSGTANQIEHWTALGMLAGAPPVGDIAEAPDWRDESRPLDARARAWLDVNCAHCHRAEGPASNSGLSLTFGEKDPVALGIGKRPVAAGRGSGGLEFDIVPGAPERSILHYRVASTEPGVMMPELGRHRRDLAAEALLKDWIASLDDR